MLGFGSKDTPEKVRKVGLNKWYSTLSSSDKVKLGRYLDKADPSSVSAFIVSVIDQAVEDHNYKFVASVYDGLKDIPLSDIERYDINDAAVVGLYNMEDYDRCVELCDIGLGLLKNKDVFDHVMARGTEDIPIPNDINCRNYKLNVVVGIHFDYDAGDKLLLEFEDMGLITPEDVEYRRNGIKTFRLQRTFDNIFNVKEKERGGLSTHTAGPRRPQVPHKDVPGRWS